MNFLYHSIFIIVTTYILINTFFYGLFEIKNNQNKTGGIVVICFSIVVVIFVNIMTFLR